jgi:quercetin dioxygenase-like cupin family protein
MTGDPKMVVVTEEFCNACGTPRVDVHHQSFPEMRISGDSLDRAVDGLATRLESNLGAVSDPLHRAPVQLAIADVNAFIDRDTAGQPKLSEVIGLRAASAPEPGASPRSLVKTQTLEVRRLTLPKGRAIPTHHAPGEITVHCLDGRVAFTANGETRELSAGQLIVLAAGEPDSLVGVEDVFFVDFSG